VQRRLAYRYFVECAKKTGANMTGNRHFTEGHSGDHGETNPGPYWQRMHRDWRFWVCAFLMAAALAVFVLSDNLAFIPSR
jgi:hypothetical protein